MPLKKQKVIKMMTDLNITQQEVARRLGKSRPYIANMLRLLQLPKNVAQMVQHGALSSAHGRTLLTLKDASKIKRRQNKPLRSLGV